MRDLHRRYVYGITHCPGRRLYRHPLPATRLCASCRRRVAAWMQHVAREMNLSETAFLCRRPDGFDLRWFTPAIEVPLCGHATLASAHVLWEDGHLPASTAARFSHAQRPPDSHAPGLMD